MSGAELEMTGPAVVLPSRYDVTTLAARAVAEATSAAAELLAVRTAEPLRRVWVDRVAACAAFLGERLLRPVGWQLPPVSDPITGDYRTADGWIRLHTNYRNHLVAALRALGLPADADREGVAGEVREWTGQDLEAAVVGRGGAAAVLHSTAEWFATAPGRAARAERLIERPAGSGGVSLPAADRPLSGVRVLDVTRVIAGPVATRFLAAHGAQVLRIDPPGFAEVPALLPEFMPGKRCAAMDLGSGRDRERFVELVRQAHVVVSGLRSDALAGLGLGVPALRAINPSLITARLDAYGWAGPWRDRRGFDSLVQMSCGIAFSGAESEPSPLPAQALDHATGYLLAAAVCRALTRQLRDRVSTDVTTSLVATANLLLDLPAPASRGEPVDFPDEVFERVDTHWGPADRVRVPGRIEGVDPHWDIDAGPLGRHDARFA
jgi:crotonobetainyl-CoA:carnitine CoA-transferase CaiB-like acyl-CoA transferase